MKDGTSRKRTRHSYINFYPENWLGGVAGLPRTVWSVYFEICLYNWDKAKPIPRALLSMMISDLGSDGDVVIEALLDADKIEQDEAGNFFSPRAMEEAEKALAAWEAKAAGGRKSSRKSSKNEEDASTSDRAKKQLTSSLVTKPKVAQANLQDSSNLAGTIIPSEFEPTSSPDAANPEGSSNLEDSSNLAGTKLDRTKNLEPRTFVVCLEKNEQPTIDDDGDFEAHARIVAAQAKADQHREEVTAHIAALSERWNAVALKAGLSQISKMTERRRELLAARLAEHGAEKLLTAIETIPASAYLTGKTEACAKPTFDWLMGEDTCAKLVEGFYADFEADKPAGEVAPPPAVIREHPNETELGGKVRAWLIQQMGEQSFVWAFGHFQPVQFHERGKSLVVVAERQSTDIAELVGKYRDLLTRAAHNFELERVQCDQLWRFKPKAD